MRIYVSKLCPCAVERKDVASDSVKIMEIPLVLSVIDSELPAYKENNNRLYDMAVG